MPKKLIVLMIDGVSANYFLTERSRLPHLAGLAERGFTVDRLHSVTAGTSFPGRTGMITGVSADISGIYGNYILDGGLWRIATPYDIRVPTLPQIAKAAGHDVAVIGFAMVRPEDTNIFKPAWWAGEYIQRGRDVEPVPAGDGWARTIAYNNPDDRMEKAAQSVGLSAQWPPYSFSSTMERFQGTLMCDHLAMALTGALAIQEKSPDLILSEVLLTDTVQHYTGYNSLMSHWSIVYADLLVGMVLERLRQTGKLAEYNIAVMSDHGHSPIEKAIHPSVVIPGTNFLCEGSTLHVVPKDAEELARITEALSVYGVMVYDSNHIPPDHRNQVVTFVAPDKVSFEADGPTPSTDPIGQPRAISSHGLKPGMPGDDRFCIFAGPDVPQGNMAESAPTRIAPTFAALLGLSTTTFPEPALFSPIGETA